jgi:hypothetical protein
MTKTPNSKQKHEMKGNILFETLGFRYSDFEFSEDPSQSGETGLDRCKEENNGNHD